MHAPVRVWISFYASAMVDILSHGNIYRLSYPRKIYSAWHSFNIWGPYRDVISVQAHSLEIEANALWMLR